MDINQLRAQINTQYLSNNVISGAEAKDLVSTVAEGALTVEGKVQLEQLRAEFKDKFSEAGLREFDKALARASESLPSGGAPAPGSVSPIQARIGQALPDAGPITLDEVRDHSVRSALARLDFNNDGKVTDYDREKMGFSPEQWNSFVYMSTLLGTSITQDDNAVPADLTGKTVCFTAVPDKAQSTAWAEAMGATVVDKVSPDLDFLFVGFAGGTAKDERAHALNVLGQADILVVDNDAFSRRAALTGVVSTPSALSQAEFESRVRADMDAWYEEHIKEHYAHELSNTTDPAERAELQTQRQNDLDNGAGVWIYPENEGDYFLDYASDGDYSDVNGVPLKVSDLREVHIDFFPEYAGIGLGKYFLYDRRTGDMIEEGDLHD